MRWEEIRERLPHQWLLVEAIEAHSEGDRRIPDQLAVVEVLGDGTEAWEAYARFHRDQPEREFYPLHTDRETLDIRERRWLGIRPAW